MEIIKLHCLLSTDDFVRVTRRLTWEAYRRPPGVYSFAVIFIIFGAMMLDLIVRDTTGTLITVGTVVALVAILAFQFWIRPILLARQRHKHLAATADMIYEFSDTYVLVKDSTAELKQDWNVYKQVILTKDYYILTLASNTLVGRHIPRRAFETPEQEAAFRDLLARKLNFKA